jgi:hypothetical protein
MISTGEEGFFNFPGDPDWAYNGADGTDFYANTELPAVSYGTFHAVSEEIFPAMIGSTDPGLLVS